jgi:hypothetical protein
LFIIAPMTNDPENIALRVTSIGRIMRTTARLIILTLPLVLSIAVPLTAQADVNLEKDDGSSIVVLWVTARESPNNLAAK